MKAIPALPSAHTRKSARRIDSSAGGGLGAPVTSAAVLRAVGQAVDAAVGRPEVDPAVPRIVLAAVRSPGLNAGVPELTGCAAHVVDQELRHGPGREVIVRLRPGGIEDLHL